MFKIFVPKTLIKIIIILTAIFLPFNSVGASYAINISVEEVHVLANQERTNTGLPELRLNSQLSAAASAKADHMFLNNYWSHNAPDGTEPWSFITASGYSYFTAGENLAKGFSYSSGVVTGWMNSPTHRANVLKDAYVDVGYAVKDGILNGEETTLVVAMYGAREAATSLPAPVQEEAPAAVEAEPVTEAPATPVSEAIVADQNPDVIGTQIESAEPKPITENTTESMVDSLANIASLPIADSAPIKSGGTYIVEAISIFSFILISGFIKFSLLFK